MNLEEATKLASALASSANRGCGCCCRIREFAIDVGSFAEKEGFERVFGAVLDGGDTGIRSFVAEIDRLGGLAAVSNNNSNDDEDGGGVFTPATKRSLAGNTALEKLVLLWDHGIEIPSAEASTSIAEQLSSALKTNGGLKELWIGGTFLRKHDGERQLMLDAFREGSNNKKKNHHNLLLLGTLLNNHFFAAREQTISTLEEEETSHRKRLRLEEDIVASVKANRAWDRYREHAVGGKGKQQPVVLPREPLLSDRSVYPAVLHELARKPMHLYEAVRSEIPQLLSRKQNEANRET